MKVTFANFGAEVASSRLRAIIPQRELGKLGIEPGKDVLVKRIRALNGQQDPAAKDDPESQMARQQQEQQRQQEQELATRERSAKVAKEEGAAKKLLADAEAQRVTTQAKALETAGLIAQSLPLAATADQVIANANMNPGVQ